MRRHLKRALVWLSIPLVAVAVQAQRGTRADVRLDTLTLPSGFSIAVYADIPAARSMTLAPDGTVFVGTWGETVHAVVDRNQDGRADEVIVVADGLQVGTGVAFTSGSLLVADVHRLLRYDEVLEFVNQPAAARTTKPPPTVITSSLPREFHHGARYLAIGPDGLLYLGIGAPCDICERADPYAAMLRMQTDGKGLEVIARGVRNSVGFDWDPLTNDLWFTDNGRDFLGDDAPPDELNRLTRIGDHFGYPYCHAGTIPDPQFGRPARSCAFYTPPAQKLGAHVAPLGMKFYTGEMFPPQYHNQIFVAEHGSWNRSTPIGYRLSVVQVDNGNAVKYETFAEGWLQGFRAWGRPADVLVLPDGSLLVADDTANVIYRITYQAK